MIDIIINYSKMNRIKPCVNEMVLLVLSRYYKLYEEYDIIYFILVEKREKGFDNKSSLF